MQFLILHSLGIQQTTVHIVMLVSDIQIVIPVKTLLMLEIGVSVVISEIVTRQRMKI